MKKSLLYLSWVFLCCMISPVNGNAACLKMKPGQNCEKQTLTGVLGDAAVPCFDEICPPCATPVLLVDNTTYYLNDVDEIDIENLLFDSFENLMHETITVTGEVFNENGYFFINISTMEKVEAHIYEPMLVKGRMWTDAVYCYYIYDGHSENYSDSVVIVGDTIINDKVYYLFNPGKMLMREDVIANEVYIRNESVDYLIYKFNINKGDTLFNRNLIDQKYAPIDLVVDSIYINEGHKTIKLHPILADTVYSGNYDEAFIYFFNEDTPDSFYYNEIIWMEGVGDIQSALHRRIWDFGRIGGYCSYNLYCVTDIDTTYYPSSRDKSSCYIPYTYSGISNNMTNKSLEVSLSNNTLEVVTPDNETIYSTCLFDITGRKIYLCNSSSTHHELTLPSGIYCVAVKTKNNSYSTTVIKQ